MEFRDSDFLIVGAGASGLAFALASVDKAVSVRIIEKRPNRSSVGKATGVSAGTWHLLKPYGITIDSCSAVIPMERFTFFDDEELVAKIDVPQIKSTPPAHLYPQAELEKHMEKKLISSEIKVE